MLLLVFVCLLSFSCMNDDGRKSPGSVLTVKYSQRLVRFIGFDKLENSTFSSYTGSRIIVNGKISKITRFEHSYSVAAEKDTVRIALNSELVLKNNRKVHVIELLYDQYALFESQVFREGDMWIISVTPEGRLVEIKPASRQAEAVSRTGSREPNA